MKLVAYKVSIADGAVEIPLKDVPGVDLFHALRSLSDGQRKYYHVVDPDDTDVHYALQAVMN